MELTQKQLVKIAENIRDRLSILSASRYGKIQQQIEIINSDQKDLQSVRDGLNKCSLFNWQEAAKQITGRVIRIVQNIPDSVGELQRAIHDYQISLPSLRDIYEELRQTRTEFGELSYNSQEETLSVFTNPIELEGVFLGSFEIRLQIPQLAEMCNGTHLRIIALDPHPSSANYEVTHPHVSAEHLCAGDAGAPMQAALLDGRISDFFLLIRSVLENYNSSSPYVAISDWDGTPCYDCGYIVCEDDGNCCEGCDNVFCNECTAPCCNCEMYFCNGCLTSCHVCKESFCGECMATCPVCEQQCCEGCMESCSECEELVCSSCIENNLCPSCKEEMENQEDEDEQTEPEESAEGNQQQVA